MANFLFPNGFRAALVVPWGFHVAQHVALVFCQAFLAIALYGLQKETSALGIFPLSMRSCRHVRSPISVGVLTRIGIWTGYKLYRVYCRRKESQTNNACPSSEQIPIYRNHNSWTNSVFIDVFAISCGQVDAVSLDIWSLFRVLRPDGIACCSPSWNPLVCEYVVPRTICAWQAADTPSSSPGKMGTVHC